MESEGSKTGFVAIKTHLRQVMGEWSTCHFPLALELLLTLRRAFVDFK